jgi:hypothetical protein
VPISPKYALIHRARVQSDRVGVLLHLAAYDGGTSIADLKVTTETRHPQLGRGLLFHLSVPLPISQKGVRDVALLLNWFEAQSEPSPSMLALSLPENVSASTEAASQHHGLIGFMPPEDEKDPLGCESDQGPIVDSYLTAP